MWICEQSLTCKYSSHKHVQTSMYCKSSVPWHCTCSRRSFSPFSVVKRFFFIHFSIQISYKITVIAKDVLCVGTVGASISHSQLSPNQFSMKSLWRFTLANVVLLLEPTGHSPRRSLARSLSHTTAILSSPHTYCVWWTISSGSNVQMNKLYNLHMCGSVRFTCIDQIENGKIHNYRLFILY